MSKPLPGSHTAARSNLAPAERAPEPAPPLIGPTGVPALDCVADTINSSFAPFRNAPPPEQGAAGWVAQGIGGVVGLIGMPQQLIDTAFGALTAPIAALFPSMPAITLLGMHVGSLHAHSHPPSLIPPAPPVPLPSIGMLVGAGSMTVLGGGMPLARAGDIGISVTCGSLAPPFEVYTGSSNVFVGGARAARILDITKHCNPTSMGPFDIAMGVAGAVAGAAGAIATGSAAAAAQAAADAAVLAFKLLCGKDPGIPPGMGALLGPPLPNVMIGGFPCPPVGDMAMGAIMKGLKKLARAVKKLRSSRRGNAHCGEGGHPIYLVTGENFDKFTDFVSSGLFCWKRHYTTARAHRPGPLGFGFRHFYERRLDMRLHKATFEDWDGVQLEFPKFPRGEDVVRAHGYVLRRLARDRYELSTRGEPTMVFAGDLFTEVLPLVGVRGDNTELRFSYDERGRLVGVDEHSLVGNARARYALHYDQSDRIIGIAELGREVIPRFAAGYTPVGELAYVRNANNGLWAYEYDAYHRWTRQVDPRGYGYTFEYDEKGRCIRARGDDGLWEASVEYFPEDKYTRYTEGAGATSIYRYDQDGFIKEIVGPDGGIRRRVRDDEGRILAEIDPGGRELSFVYDADGANVARVDRFGYVHPPEAEAPRLADPFARNLPKTALARSFAGMIDASHDAMYGATPRLLDVPPELLELAHATFRMREQGAPAIAEPARRWRDPLGNVYHELDGLGRVRRWQYDACGNEVARQDRDGRIYRRETISWNLLGARSDPLGNTIRYRYDSIEQMTELSDPLGNTSGWTYDLCQRLVAVSRHGRVRDRYEYESDRFAAKLDGDGQLIFRNLDWHDNKLVTRRMLGSGGEHHLDYDVRGRVTKASTDVHDIRLAHDARGMKVLDQRDGKGLARTRAHGVERVRLFDRFEYRCVRASDDRLELVAPNGAVTRVRHGSDGVVLRECSNGTQEWLQYDHEGRLEGRMTARRDGHGHRGWGVRYGYSAEGDLLSVADAARGTTRYEFDEAHRLVAVLSPSGERSSYEFDAADNLVRANMFSRLAISPGNRVDASSTEVFEHDGRDRVGVRRHRDGPVKRYFYDSLDMLVRVESEADDGRRTWTAAYDALGRRLWCEGPKGRREFWWDGDRLAAELDPAGRLRIHLYADHRALTPFAFVDYASLDAAPESGRLYHVFCDPIGMPLQIEDDRGQIVWWAAQPDPWGQLDIRDDAKLEYNLRWPGHYFDAETGLHYNRYRYYDPSLGRYLTPDPIGYRGSEVNLYAYCSNPLVHVDVLGLHPDKTNPNDSTDPKPTDGDGPEHPPPNQHHGEDGMKVSKDQAVEMATAAAHKEREVVAQKIASGEIKPGQEPACTAGVVDRRTGEVFTAHNQPKTTIANPKDFHPLLQERIAQQQKRHADGQDHFSEPGTHAEVLALDKALKKRQAQQPDVPLTHDDLGEFTQVPMWSREIQGKKVGDPAPCCGHCAPITRGTHNPAGDAERFVGKPTGDPTNPYKWDRISKS